jgi:predicted regulator of Ras-like GTPase activity (Roadblock/LC7/MglB family)
MAWRESSPDIRLSPKMNIIITQKDLEQINFCLNKMVSSSLAQSVLLIDRSGQLIAHHGNAPGIDMPSLSALTAANFGATAEIAKILGEEEFTLLFHKGRNENVYFSAVGEHVILVTLFDNRTSLGVIRLQIGKIIDELSKILLTIFEKKRVLRH